MQDINNNITLPFDLKIGFNKLLNYYEELEKNEDEFLAAKARRVLKTQENSPLLREGFSDLSYLKTYEKEINIILQDSFSQVLTKNEIKTATVPFHNMIFNSSQRFKTILEAAGDDYEIEIENMPDNDKYIIACNVILKAYYGYSANFSRPLYYQIPDTNGIIRYYKILYNADFIEVIKKDNTPEITEEDYKKLLDNFEDIALWKEKFPPNSYIAKGFVISNIVDITADQSISNIKSSLIVSDKQRDKRFMSSFKEIFRSFLGMQDLDVGFSVFNEREQLLMQVPDAGIQSLLLDLNSSLACEAVFCHNSYKTIFDDKVFYSNSDLELYYNKSKGKVPQVKVLYNQGYKSAILAPIADGENLLGILELVSTKKHALNSIVANKLVDVMPFIYEAVKRSKIHEANLIQAIIQSECTAIHPSVHWKFEKAARQFMLDSSERGDNATFGKIIFRDVYPLFGQMDVKGSSNARNQATQKDLLLQLLLVKKIIDKGFGNEKLPVYEKLKFQIEKFSEEINTDFKVDSEQKITAFFKNELDSVLKFKLKSNSILKQDIKDYFSKIDKDLGVVYNYRKKYDDTIMLINKNMSSLIDKKQIEAQKMYPHFFERFKTDGVEHNMYIGEDITKENSFNNMYLYNLRLWQLQVMCDMENSYYNKRSKYPVSLDVASMILVFNQPLSIRFRMDEKHFDVDGTYNARYEVVKKRVDKANIKGTNERATVEGKLTIVYSQKADEIEYLEYINFLQFKHVLGDNVEVLELEDLQGVTGLKALRVEILYSKSKKDNKQFYTYNDLMNEIKA
ncbi:GAF domain-containing protein [Lacinutrix sp.]|uniref:GAF domain-containing protein n=1 Tax=Lacinutrix sp. TaxID=1937692 RepID=UPI0025C611B6|nr:GAF domain-containing protein [Lacinutrix sp.]